MFAPVTTIVGPAAVLPKANVDTDVIIRIDRLIGANRDELRAYAFESIRYDSEGEADPSFPLNRPRWRDAPILLAGANFGCGSSREPAVLALLAVGLRCVIAPSFGDIFRANCFQNGLVPIELPVAIVESLMRISEARMGDFTVDIAACTIRTPTKDTTTFPLDAQRREALIAGLDDMGLTLRDVAAIDAFQAADRSARPWIWAVAP